METIQKTVDQASEKAQGMMSGTSKEANKNVAKDSDASLGTRMEAGKDAASDKLDETKHSAAEEKNKH